MSVNSYHPCYWFYSGQKEKMEKQYGIVMWDDRDPEKKDLEGTPSSYIFEKTRPCQVSLGKLVIQRKHNQFYLVDKGYRVARAHINIYQEVYGDISIETLEPYRRQGYATLLFGWVSDWLNHKGLLHISTCSIDNKASIRMHEKLGFIVTGHIRWARRDTLPSTLK